MGGGCLHGWWVSSWVVGVSRLMANTGSWVEDVFMGEGCLHGWRVSLGSWLTLAHGWRVSL